MLPYTRLIHEKLSNVLTFAYSWATLDNMLDTKFKGEWKYLRKTIFDIGPENAVRAFIELAGYLRLLDDKDDLSGYLKQTGSARGFGRVLKKDGSEEPLFLRDLTNKIIHAKEWKWDVSTTDRPKAICISNNPDRWVSAEIDIQTFAAFADN